MMIQRQPCLIHYYRNSLPFAFFIFLLVFSFGAVSAPAPTTSLPVSCPPVKAKGLPAGQDHETIFYAATVRKDKTLHVCSQGETITYSLKTADDHGTQSETVRRFNISNVAWVYDTYRSESGGVTPPPVRVTGTRTTPAKVGLVLHEQSIAYAIMTGNNFDTAFSTLVVQDKSKRLEKVRFDQSSVINNIIDWSQKHHVKKTTDAGW